MLFAQVVYLIVMCLLLLYAIIIVVRLFPLVTFAYQTLPFVPISKRAAKALVRLPELQGKQRIVDLGCGRGTMLVAVRKQFPQADLVGVEYKHSLVQQARLRAKFWKKPAEIIEGDMFAYDVSTFDAVVGWWISSINARMVEKLAKECKPGCVVVSYMFALPSNAAFTEKLVKVGKEKLFVYTKLSESQS